LQWEQVQVTPQVRSHASPQARVLADIQACLLQRWCQAGGVSVLA
jgi:hypothetical protein